MSFMPNQAAKAAIAMNGTQTKPAFCSQSGVSPVGPLTMAGSPPSQPKTPAVIAERHQELHDADAEVAEAGVERQRVALLRLREEEGDVGHRRGEVAAAEAAQQRQDQEEDSRACRGSAPHSRCRAPGSAATRWRAWSTAARRRSAP